MGKGACGNQRRVGGGREEIDQQNSDYALDCCLIMVFWSCTCSFFIIVRIRVVLGVGGKVLLHLL